MSEEESEISLSETDSTKRRPNSSEFPRSARNEEFTRGNEAEAGNPERGHSLCRRSLRRRNRTNKSPVSIHKPLYDLSHRLAGAFFFGFPDFSPLSLTSEESVVDQWGPQDLDEWNWFLTLHPFGSVAVP
jgi:hypothetical protein